MIKYKCFLCAFIISNRMILSKHFRIFGRTVRQFAEKLSERTYLSIVIE